MPETGSETGFGTGAETGFEAYTLTAALGTAPGARLHRGVRVRDGAEVLVEVAPTGPADSRAAERLRREAEILGGLDGSCTPAPLGLLPRRGEVWLVLAGADGEPLPGPGQLPLDAGRFLDAAMALAAALADLHRQGIVHRDLRPANVLVDPASGRATLVGLGIAERMSRVTAAPRPASRVEGSPAYMAPEQTGHLNLGVDHRSDLYSLGVILYELLTGELPFTATDPLEWAHGHIARLPRPPSAIVPGLAAGLEGVVLRLLAKEPAERYQSARGLLADLEHCRRQWSAAGTVPAFRLGTQDTFDRFVVSSRLYGREAEVARLTAGFDRARSARGTELVLVRGYSGIGKSSLVLRLRWPVAEAKGYFAAGKYDRYQRDVPYATLAAAFRELVRQILTESEERVRRWREELVAAVGPNGGVLVDLIPELELLIGVQPPVAELLPSEAEHRFHLVFRRFLGVLARPEHPLVLFLDDLQWFDPAGLKLLAHLLAAPTGSQTLLVVGAYRDNEVDASHPLAATLAEIRAGGIEPVDLVLGPLPPEQLAELIADTVRRPVDDVEPLARLVHEKTGGNPFFAIQFLTTLHQEGLLRYDEAGSHWQWDVAEIRGQGFTDNVVELMLGKLRRTAVATQEALMLAACLGSTVAAASLSAVTGVGGDELDATLREAMDGGLLGRSDDGYTFLHDRMQEAAYMLLPAAQRAARHLTIGRRLLATTDPDRLPENVFEVVGQLNRGAALIIDPAERQRVAELNLLAGKRAKGSTAFASAANYLAAGLAVLPERCWESARGLAFTLHVELAECRYLLGDFARSEALLALTLRRAGCLAEQARVHRLRQRLYQLSGRFHEAVDVAREALELFGMVLPDDDAAIVAATDEQLREVAENLAGRQVSELAEAQFTDDEEARAFIGLLAEAMPLVYGVRPVLWPLITTYGVNVCLRRGNAEESPFVYSCYAMVLVGVRRDIPAAVEYSQTALALNDRSPAAAAWRGKLLLHHGALISIWRRPFAVNLPLLDRAFRDCLDSGDLVHAGYLTYNAIWLHLESGESLDEVVALARRYVEFAQENHNDVVQLVDRVEEQFARCLQGRTRSSTDLSDDEFDEGACVAAIERAGFGLGIAYHHIMKLIAAFVAGDVEQAQAWAERADPLLLHVSSMANEATYHFFRALTLAALHDAAPAPRRSELVGELHATLDKLTLWAWSCPENFADRRALVQAELARIEGRDVDAARLYDEALRCAEESGFVHTAAVAAERAAAFHRSRGFDRIAAGYLREARTGYARWGAAGKVRLLDAEYPELAGGRAPGATELLSARTEQLDLLSVVKASQAISGEIVRERLQETLIRLALEHAGAQRGCLLLADGEELTVRAVAEGEGERIRVDLLPALPVTSEAVPMSLVNYVRRSGETVVLADVAEHDRYAGDPYFRRRRTRSVLGLPITWQGRQSGLLYLENDLVAGAFMPSRLVVLELLAAQAAISLETARLYADLQQENAERRRAEDEVRELNRDLERRVNIRTAQLEASNQDLAAFADSVSHDLRAPLRSIHGFVRILLEDHADQLDEDARQVLGKVVRRSERMGHLIDDLLSFSRTGRQGLACERIDLAGLVTDVLRELEPDGQGRQVRQVRWRIGALPVVRGDRATLRVVLVNLIGNALKFTRPRACAQIEIGWRPGAGEDAVFVRDDGVGFDRRHADRVFGVFQRLHTEEEFEGTGIGLATVRRIVERHGGRVWADAEPGRGATFWFALPR